MVNLVLCGGVGSRLWPLSRSSMPKQFAKILSDRSLFEDTVLRNRRMCDRVLVASNRDQLALARRQLRGIGIVDHLELEEPVGRNTAPAIALACMALPPEETVLVCPSDQAIGDQPAYRAAVDRARTLAEAGRLVTFGIKPEYPETGYGYIQTQAVEPERVVSFREKPDFETARSYVDSGNYWWNSGMFCFKAGVFLAELARHAPDVWDKCRRAAASDTPLRPTLEAMQAIPAISVDYALMEKSDNVCCVACAIDWSDLGSFDALYDHLSARDGHGANSVSGTAPILIDSQRNLVVGAQRLIALIGMNDSLVVDTGDAVLVAKRGSSQKVKDLFEMVQSSHPSLAAAHTSRDTDWGQHATLHREGGVGVNRLQVAAGSAMKIEPSGADRSLTIASGDGRLNGAPVGAGGSVLLRRGETCLIEALGSNPVVAIEIVLAGFASPVPIGSGLRGSAAAAQE